MLQNFGNMNSFARGQEAEEGESHSLDSADTGKGKRWQRQHNLFQVWRERAPAENVSFAASLAACCMQRVQRRWTLWAKPPVCKVLTKERIRRK